MDTQVIIVVRHKSLRERPRAQKIAAVMAKLGVAVEVWKFGDPGEVTELGVKVRNILDASHHGRRRLLHYVLWMAAVLRNWWRQPGRPSYFAVGFDSAFPLSLASGSRRWLVFDNPDNISLSYRWPRWLVPLLRSLEAWVAKRARFHIVPSRARWPGNEPSLRIVANTPSREAVEEAQRIAQERGYRREETLTVYVNGWLTKTRGIGTLLEAVDILRRAGVSLRILVAGQPASEESERLLKLECTEYLGLITNTEALAAYFRTHVVFCYYDPSIAINRVAESQKWMDAWATDTPFISNHGIETLQPYIQKDACFVLHYSDAPALANLLASLASDRTRLDAVRTRLQAMNFGYWDDEMERVVRDWLAPSKYPRPTE